MKMVEKALLLLCLIFCGLTGCTGKEAQSEIQTCSLTDTEGSSVSAQVIGQERKDLSKAGLLEKKEDGGAISEIETEKNIGEESVAKANETAKAVEGNADEAEPGTDEAKEGTDEAEEEEERELTEQELKKLQWSLRSADNGFFACQYYRPEEIDWQQVFYMGAGMNVSLDEGQLEIIRENMREEIRQERIKEEELWELYLETNSLYVESEEEEETQEAEEEIEVELSAGDVTTLTLRSIQNFVKSRTGMDYSEARKPLNWPQLTKNVFYFVREGTNRVQVKLIRATVKGNLYHLYYRLNAKRGQTEPEYVMTVEIDGYQWRYQSNLSLQKTEPITLLDVEYFSSGEIARLQGTKEMFNTLSETDDADRQQEPAQTSSKSGKKSSKTSIKEPAALWAVITAKEDNTRIAIERAYLGDDISLSLAQEGYFIPGETISTVALQKGGKIGIRVKLEDIPKVRVRASSGNYYGEYAFGSENSLKRTDAEGMPKSTYVVGYDLNGEGRGTEYGVKDELLAFLKGTWVYYDGMQGEYTAKLVFDEGDKIHLSMTGLTYELECGKWNRIYADEGMAPDVLTFRTSDEKTQELINLWYPEIRKKMGDYRIRAVQKDGIQMLYFTPENSGAGCLSSLLPGATQDADEFVFYRFIGATASQDPTADKG